jgi:hypothetical protein
MTDAADNDPTDVESSGDTPGDTTGGTRDDPAPGHGQESNRDASGDRYDALLRDAAHRLADAVAPYGVLTRAKLGELSGASRWETIDFEVALPWAVEHDYLRRVGEDSYEVGPEASRDDSTRVVIEGGW